MFNRTLADKVRSLNRKEKKAPKLIVSVELSDIKNTQSFQESLKKFGKLKQIKLIDRHKVMAVVDTKKGRVLNGKAVAGEIRELCNDNMKSLFVRSLSGI